MHASSHSLSGPCKNQMRVSTSWYLIGYLSSYLPLLHIGKFHAHYWLQITTLLYPILCTCKQRFIDALYVYRSNYYIGITSLWQLKYWCYRQFSNSRDISLKENLTPQNGTDDQNLSLWLTDYLTTLESKFRIYALSAICAVSAK